MRSHPGAHGGSAACAGWEHVLAFDLLAHAPRVAAEAIELLTAPPCPSGRATVILGGEQLALQVHESIGHALELDRMLLGEASHAGTSWVSPTDLGALRYGSEQLQITADATLAGGLGSFGWDDEGVAAARTTLIEDGILRAALSDRQAAAAIGLERSGGCARADGLARQPIVRMTNVSIEPGTAGSLGDLVADTGEGLYLECNRSWSIDDRRLHFQFATEIAREIRGGALTRRAGRRRLMLDLAHRALALAGPDMQVTVVRERSLLSRFARSAPTQATAVDDTSVEILAVRDGHTASATTNRLDDDALRLTALRAEAGALASARSGRGEHPGLAEPALPAAAHAGFDAETAKLDPGRAGAALSEAFAVGADHGLEPSASGRSAP